VVFGLVGLPSAAMARQEPEPGVATGSSESHLFFGATARSLAPGHGYFSIRELGLGMVQVGVTDRFSFGAGTVLFYPKVAVFTPKYQFYRGRTVTAAVGLAHVTRFGEEGLGAAYGAVTKEFESGSLTAGGGWLYARGDDHVASSAVAMIGGEQRISPRVSLLTENYVFFAGGAMVSGGVRLNRGVFTAEFGLMAPIAEGDFAVGPIINLGWRF
jgi:hypothetical protein